MKGEKNDLMYGYVKVGVLSSRQRNGSIRPIDKTYLNFKMLIEKRMSEDGRCNGSVSPIGRLSSFFNS
jgi:hypothetical protein